ncbi:MAG: hypothetical protein MJ169_03925 [Treponema sp.]|nr:hypothetical protein [Treponema sp.]
MNKSIVKKSLAAIAFLSLTLCAATANPAKNQKKNPRPDCRRPSPQRMIAQDEFNALGTITAIDQTASTITIADADGKESVIHVNPLTKIFEIKKPGKDFKAEKAPAKDEKAEDKKPAFRPPVFLDFTDLKTGDWIAMKKYHNGTKIPEAKILLIKVAAEKK